MFHLSLKTLLQTLGATMLAGMLGLGLARVACAQDFYRNKTINLIVASGPGGGYDTYARALAPHLRRHIPGEPIIVVQHMPAAGGNAGAGYVFNVAPKDGTVLLAGQREVVFGPLLGNKQALFDPAKFQWIGSLNTEVGICGAWTTAPVKTFRDLLMRQLIVAGNGPNFSEYMPAFMNNLIGTKFKLVTGYPDGTNSDMAVERGEVEGRCGWSYSSLQQQHPDWLRDNRLNVLIQTSLIHDKNLPPEIPLIADFAPDADVRRMLEVLLLAQITGRPYAAPPGTPADRVAVLRKAFDDLVADPQFAAAMGERKLELTPVAGADIQAKVENAMATSPELIVRMNDAIRYKGDPR
jgi:tripartite-type tricarboxylate transporter receptor subunit TctC